MGRVVLSRRRTLTALAARGRRKNACRRNSIIRHSLCRGGSAIHAKRPAGALRAGSKLKSFQSPWRGLFPLLAHVSWRLLRCRASGRSVCEDRMLHCGGPGCARHPQARAPLQFSGRRRNQGIASRRRTPDKVRCPQHPPGMRVRWIGRRWSREIADAERGVRQRDI